jgi:ubiquinone/menaquinone biosynthesis C-methylase UbiE
VKPLKRLFSGAGEPPYISCVFLIRYTCLQNGKTHEGTPMFTKTAALYDIIYHWKDYAAESNKLRHFIQQHKQTPSTTLLDVGCGTGRHLEHLRAHYVCEGLDLDPELLKAAAQRLPDVPLHQGNMIDFDLGRTFAAITCLFGSVAYTQNTVDLKTAVANMARHVEPGGLLIVEPFLFREEFTPGKISLQTAEVPGLSIARMTVSRLENDTAYFTFNYLVGTAEGVQHLEEAHVLGVFTRQEYQAALESPGLSVTFDEDGLMGRGLFIGVKP